MWGGPWTAAGAVSPEYKGKVRRRRPDLICTGGSSLKWYENLGEGR